MILVAVESYDQAPLVWIWSTCTFSSMNQQVPLVWSRHKLLIHKFYINWNVKYTIFQGTNLLPTNDSIAQEYRMKKSTLARRIPKDPQNDDKDWENYSKAQFQVSADLVRARLQTSESLEYIVLLFITQINLKHITQITFLAVYHWNTALHKNICKSFESVEKLCMQINLSHQPYHWTR